MNLGAAELELFPEATVFHICIFIYLWLPIHINLFAI